MAFRVAQRLRPILKWAGGKSGPLAQMVPLFPESFRRYFEPFIGGAAVYLALDERVPAFLNDSNPDLVELYEVIRDFPRELMAALDVLTQEYSEEFYYRLRQTMPDNKVARVARTIFLNKTGFNGLYRLNSKGQFNVPFGKRQVCPRFYERRNILAVSRKLAAATVSCGDFEALLQKAGEGDFIYCDPPYEPLSRTSAFTSYTSKGFSQDDQKRLEAACRAAVNRGAKVAVSNSTAPFILDLYRDWTVHTIRAKRAINSKGTARGEIYEIVATLGYAPQLEPFLDETKQHLPTP